MNKACFLDRDGILNNAITVRGKPFAPLNEKDFKIKKNFLPVANHLKLPVSAISVITDEGDPDNLKPVNIDEIIAMAEKAEPNMIKLFKEVVKSV